MNMGLSSPVFGERISCWDSRKLDALDQRDLTSFQLILDEMGKLSSKAQGLSMPLTTADKLRKNNDRVYMMCDATTGLAQGFLRVGRKHLYLYPDDTGSLLEDDTLCLLDVYVHASLQRRGLGSVLFAHAMKKEGVTPAGIAYDRPSAKLMAFLKRHFGLRGYTDQPNRFMVFKEFFDRPDDGGGAVVVGDRAVVVGDQSWDNETPRSQDGLHHQQPPW